VADGRSDTVVPLRSEPECEVILTVQSYETTAWTALSDEHLDSAAGASFPAIGTSAPSQPSGNRDHRPTSNETITVPWAASTGH